MEREFGKQQRSRNVRRACVVCAALVVAVGGGSVAVAASAASAVSQASATDGSGATQRGSVVSVHRIDHFDVREVRDEVGKFGLPTDDVRHPVTAYRVVYRTIDPRGRATTVSGLVLVPRRMPEGPQRVVVYEHGTTVVKDGAPSQPGAGDNRAFPLFYASAGYFTVAPDYLGLGAGPGMHPYDHAATEASASLDLLRAARAVARGGGVRLDERVLVTGFSQGGHAAMALGRALDAGADARFRLGALAPVAGPYDMEGVMLPASLQYQGAEVNFTLAYITLAWNPIYGLYDRPDEVFLPDWADRIANLFDGTHNADEIIGALPARLDQLFQPAYVAQLRNPSGGLLAGLRENDRTCMWRPSVPVRLYAARADTHVPFPNTLNCAARLTEQGADVQVVDVGDVDHFPSARLAAARVLSWFAAQR